MKKKIADLFQRRGFDILFSAINIGLLAYLWIYQNILINPERPFLLLLGVFPCLYLFTKFLSFRSGGGTDATGLVDKYWPDFCFTAANMMLIFYSNPVIFVITPFMIVISGLWLCPRSA